MTVCKRVNYVQCVPVGGGGGLQSLNMNYSETHIHVLVFFELHLIY